MNLRDVFPQELIVNKNSTQALTLGKYQPGAILEATNNLIDYFPSSLKETYQNRTWMPAQVRSAIDKVSSIMTPSTPEEGVKMGMVPIKTGEGKYTYVNPPMGGMKIVGPKAAEEAAIMSKSLINKGIAKLKGKTDDLINIAKKYKSAEEFVKAQELLYHGTDKTTAEAIKKAGGFTDETAKVAKDLTGYKVSANKPISLTLDEATGKLYAGPRPLGGDGEMLTFSGKGLKIADEATANKLGKNIDKLKKAGYDGYHTSSPHDEMVETIVFNKEKLKLTTQTKSQLTDIWNKANPEPIYKGEKDLTTKILKRLEGKSVTSKQEILDFTNMGNIKQAEKDLIRDVANTYKGKEIPVKEFASKVKQELLPLELSGAGNQSARLIELDKQIAKAEENGNMVLWRRLRREAAEIQDKIGGQSTKYESISLPDELRGNVANYSEHIWESPIKTSAGEKHWQGQSQNYFGHTRVEDLPAAQEIKGKVIATRGIEKSKNLSDTRRVIELQSDLYQKGELEREMTGFGQMNDNSFVHEFSAEEVAKKGKEMKKLFQYNDPTAHFRMAREEIKQATKDGKTKLQFPTGETGMKIEGLGENPVWYWKDPRSTIRGGVSQLSQENIKAGQEIGRLRAGNDLYSNDRWIITDVLGDGKFKAVPKERYDFIKIHGEDDIDNLQSLAETFDISGKIDQSNPIYRFYEKTLGSYLKNNFNAKLITDPQGVSWWEVPIQKAYKKAVEAFSMIPPIFITAQKLRENKEKPKLIWQ